MANIDKKLKQDLLNYLMTFVTENKRDLFEQNIRNRTRYLTVVLENIFQPHNASAVLRTCDCFGIQDVHIIENKNKYTVNPDVALGSSKWLTLIRHDKRGENTLSAYRQLKKQGYRIVATSPHKKGILPGELPLDQKTALVFGTELEGLSRQAIENADLFVRIPMFGFTESFNISVSAAILLYHLSENLRKSRVNWMLTEDEIIDIKLEWVKNVIKRSDLLEKRFLKNL